MSIGGSRSFQICKNSRFNHVSYEPKSKKAQSEHIIRHIQMRLKLKTLNWSLLKIQFLGEKNENVKRKR